MGSSLRTKLFRLLIGSFFVYAIAVTLLWLFAALDGLENAILMTVVIGAYLPLMASLLFWLCARNWRRHEDVSTGKLRKILEKEQIQSEAVMTALDEGVLIINKDGIVKYVNHRMSEMMATDQYIVGMHFSKLISEHVTIVSSSSRKPRLSYNVVRAFETGEPILIEHERLMYPATKTYIDVMISLVPLKNEHGEMSALMIVGRDISSLIRVQEKESLFTVRAGERLAGSLQSVEQQIAEMVQMSNIEERVAGKLGELQTSVGWLSQLVNDVQMYTSLSSGVNEKELKFVDIATVFNKSAERARTHHAQKFVIVTQEIATPTIIADESQLQVVVDQLVDNAYKFSPDRDTVLVRAVADGTTAVIEVADNGAGISEEQRETIFEPFVKDFDKQNQNSTGLGMSICKRIVDDWGGDIRISSQEAGGVVFTCTIPGALRADAADEEDASTPSYLDTVVDEPPVAA